MPSSPAPLLARRAMLAAGAALPFALPQAAVARSPGALPPLSTIARLKLGTVEVTLLSDGAVDLPFAAFTGAQAAAVERLAQARHAASSGNLRIGITTWLVNDGDSLVLIDAGAAGLAGADAGRLPAALRAAGVDPAQIDAIASTHWHFDHIGGLVAGGRAVFPNAELYAHRDDVAHFTDAARPGQLPELLRGSYAAAREVVARYPRLQRFDGERAITRSVSAIDLRGHTPGHMGYRIEGGGQTLLIVGDLLFHPAVHPRDPAIGVVFEEDAAAAAAVRARLYGMALESGALLAATHMPFPGLGRVVRDGGALAWLPADYPLG